MTTYSWPWLNSGWSKYNPTLFNVWHWTFFIVIANVILIEKFRFVFEKGIVESNGVESINNQLTI